MKKKAQKKSLKRKKPTITFQPESDVTAILESLNLKHGDVSRLVNEAIRVKHSEAALNLAIREREAADAKVRALQALQGKA